jgi:crotonobetainyl-CoA:carnitine CoA-transferase CaiB-like acyl-CoA transferase
MPDFLTGIRVVDVSQYVPGPYAALQLADMGADVVKVEPPAGDPMRHLVAVDADGLSPFYKVVNGGKKVVRLDLKSDSGKAAFETLLTAADVLVESYRPGVMDRLGFDRAKLDALNPGLVHCAITGWGQTGPYRLRANHDLNCMALGGGLAASGTADRPVAAWPPASDYASGIQGAAAICGALVRRGRSGRGAFIDMSMMETVLAWQSGGLTAAARPGMAPRRASDLINGGAACYGIYRTADGRFLTLGNLEEKFWANFCAAAGRPDWIPRQWEAMPQDDLIAEVGAAIVARTLAEWEALLEGVDTCYQAVLDFDEVPDHPHVEARQLVHRFDDGRVEASFPAWTDGHAPDPRPEVVEISIAEATARWAPPA